MYTYILSFYLVYHLHVYVFCDHNAFGSMTSFCWMVMVSKNYSETVKYDEKQQTKNQRVNILQTRFILCSLYYLAAHHACLIQQSTTMQNNGSQYYTTLNSNKIQLSNIIRSDVWKHFPWSNLMLSLCTLYSVSQKKSPLRFSKKFSQTDGNFLINFYTPIIRSFLHCHRYCNYKFLFNYLQLWRSYAILNATTQRSYTFH